ncbi:AAA family ATPase [Streptomyces sp. NPDC093109]|uniref:AAA family ATPase n=1 Tax=Streptomyces sp. NPDC093109 TaxID=3154977 RepID=UPI00345024C8
MQHSAGDPLPPPRGPGPGGWVPGAPPPGAGHQQHVPGWTTGAHPAPGQATGRAPGQLPGQIPGPGGPGQQGPGAPAPAYPGPGARQAPPPTHAPPPAQPPRPPAMPPPTAPAQDATGHIALPPGGPVPIPVPAPPQAGNGTGAATLAVLLIGPAGAGKTTVARHWAKSRRVPTAHISLDDVREWVCAGFADPQSGWNEHSEAQYRLARRTCGFAARNFLANGISCILDDAVFPDRPVVGLGGWKRHVGPGLLPVVLLPGLEIVLERNAERSGNRRLADEEVAGIHGRMAGWYGSGLPIIDNSTYDVETTARALDDVLARALASPPSW